MTELRKRMIESLQLRGMSERTQEAYVRAVRQLAQHYKKSPDLVTEEELRQYFLYIKNVKNYARATTTIALCGIKFFVEWTLGRKWTLFELVRPPHEKKLPTILSIEEARKILGCVRLLGYRVCLSTIYSCGLRLQEGTHLRVADIDSSRMIFTFVTAREPRIAMCRCRNVLWRCCASTGRRIGIRSCCSRPKAAAI